MYKAITAALAALVFSVSASAKVTIESHDAHCYWTDTNGKFAPVVHSLWGKASLWDVRRADNDLDTEPQKEPGEYTTKQYLELAIAGDSRKINCHYSPTGHEASNSSVSGMDFIQAMIAFGPVSSKGYIEIVLWALENGWNKKNVIFGPTTSSYHNKTTIDIVEARLKYHKRKTPDSLATNGVFDFGITHKEAVKVYERLLYVLGPPAAATKPCVEVDGQSPFSDFPKIELNEYCIVAESLQSSRAVIAATDMEKRFIGGRDYRYEADKELSGAGLFPGWKSTITFTCSPLSSGCGYADYILPENFTPEAIKIWQPIFEERYGLGVFCGESADLLDLTKDLEPGESVSVIQSSDTKRFFPSYFDCHAKALDPFSLHILTTRLAKK